MADYLILVAEPGASAPAVPGHGVDAQPAGGLGARGLGTRGMRLMEGRMSPRGTVFDGIGVFGGALVRSSAEAEGVEGAGRGNYLLARHAEDGCVTIEIDPLGYHPLHVYHADGLFCAATRPERMVEALASVGRPVDRDLAVHGWFTVQGSGAFDLTAYRGVSLLPGGTTVRIDPANRVAYERRPVAELFYAPRPAAELIDEAAHEILLNVRALADGAFDHRLCDLSGGMDSRLVVSAILHERLQDGFLFHTNGVPPNADANVAAHIRRRFGLRKSGRVVPPSAWTEGSLQQLRRSVGRTSGLMSSYFRTTPGRADAEARILAMGGGSGELLRQFWSSGTPGAAAPAPAPSRWRVLMDRLRREEAPADPTGSPLRVLLRGMEARTRFLHADRRGAYRRSVEDFAAQSVAAGVAAEHVGDHYYLASRARYHFGVWWARSTRARFHPLYSVAAVQAAHALPNDQKAANRLGFELMRRFCPDLVAIPFADKRWSPLVMPDAPDPVTSRTPFLGDPAERAVSSSGRQRSAPRRELSERARALAASGAKRQVVELDTMLRAFHASGPDYGVLAPVFDVDAVRAFLCQPPEAFSGPYDVNDAYRLMGAHVWASRTETSHARSGEQPAA